MGKRIVLIPAYKPEDKMLRLLESLKEYQDAEKEADREIDGILVVDDGGQESFRALFEAAEAMGCRVVHHRENRGKGAAIRTGLQAAMEFFGPDIHVVTADADGQHLPADIVRIARTLSENCGKAGPCAGSSRFFRKRSSCPQYAGQPDHSSLFPLRHRNCLQ